MPLTGERNSREKTGLQVRGDLPGLNMFLAPWYSIQRYETPDTAALLYPGYRCKDITDNLKTDYLKPGNFCYPYSGEAKRTRLPIFFVKI